MTWQQLTYGRACASFGKPFYGEPRIIINAPADAIDDVCQVADLLRAFLNELQDTR